jgi:hypothetical protein
VHHWTAHELHQLVISSSVAAGVNCKVVDAFTFTYYQETTTSRFANAMSDEEYFQVFGQTKESFAKSPISQGIVCKYLPK